MPKKLIIADVGVDFNGTLYDNLRLALRSVSISIRTLVLTEPV